MKSIPMTFDARSTMSKNIIVRMMYDYEIGAYLWLFRKGSTGFHFRIAHPTGLDVRALLAWECKMVLRRSIGAGELPLPPLSCTSNDKELVVPRLEDARQFLISDHMRALDEQATEFFREIERQHSDIDVVAVPSCKRRYRG